VPPAAPLTVVVRDAQPVQAPFAAVAEHPDVPNGRPAPRACGRLPELIGTLVLQEPLDEQGALEERHHLESAARYMSQHVHASDERQVTVDDNW
jgi:hypothetical protein